MIGKLRLYEPCLEIHNTRVWNKNYDALKLGNCLYRQYPNLF